MDFREIDHEHAAWGKDNFKWQDIVITAMNFWLASMTVYFSNN
jgi:hypothetical protein